MEYQKIIKLSKTSLQNNSETVTNDSVKYISLEKRQKKKKLIIWMNYNSIIMQYQKIIKLLQNISINQVNLEQKY